VLTNNFYFHENKKLFINNKQLTKLVAIINKKKIAKILVRINE
jgi:hypothetical protein